MLSKAQEIIARYEDLNEHLSIPETLKDQQRFKALSVEQKELLPSYHLAKEYLLITKEIHDAQEILKGDLSNEEKQFYQELLNANLKQQKQLEADLISASKPKDPHDNRNVILEIRAGTGGNEATLFAADLYRMYLRYAENKNWQVEQLTETRSESGGFKEVICSIKGHNIYGELKYENGVHRVQRVPATESAGRIHTSTASVVVLPEVEDFEVNIKDEELRIDVFRSGGPGGQSVNTTDSAVRITHLPTGIVVSCQDEKSQLKNKHRALSVLKSRLYDLELSKKMEKETAQRRNAIQGGDRSVKIRTYNYPQNRVTDHRIKVTWHNLAGIMNGDVEEMLQTLKSKLS